MMKSVTPENNLPPNFAANLIIEKGSAKTREDLNYLKAIVKKGEKANANSKDKAEAKAAAANLNSIISK